MKLHVSKHAVHRYIERVKPQLGEELALREMRALLELAKVVERPAWITSTEAVDRWLLVAPDCVAAVRNDTVTTVITPERIEARRRKKQREIERKERIRKRSTRRALRGHGNGRPEARIESEVVWPT